MKKNLYSIFLPALLGIFLFLSTEGYSHSSSSSSKECSECSHHEFRSFQLADFKGNFIIYATSIGGINRNDIDSIVGLSTSGVGQATFRKNGRGLLNYVSVSQYTGPILAPGNLQSFTLTNLPITITLIDPVLGLGTIVVENYPTPGSNLNGIFAAVKKEGLVEKFIINVTGYSGTAPQINTGANLIIAERQTHERQTH